MEQSRGLLPGVLRAWDENSDAQIEVRFDRNFPSRTHLERDGETVDPDALGDSFSPEQKQALKFVVDLLSDPVSVSNARALTQAESALKQYFQFVDTTP